MGAHTHCGLTLECHVANQLLSASEAAVHLQRCAVAAPYLDLALLQRWNLLMASARLTEH
jgi:hypothetical protein